MADNKIIDEPGAAQDDWLANSEETAEDGLFSELDQANIDALLSTDALDAADGRVTPTTEASASAAVEEMGGDLSQDDIDALLGIKPSAPVAASPVAAAVEEMGGDLSQDDIDALLGIKPSAPVAASPVAAAAVEEMGGDLSQDDIDALLGIKPSAPAAAKSVEEAASTKEGIREIDNSSLDALFKADNSSEISAGINALIGGVGALAKTTAGTPMPSLEALASGVPSQEEMDKIFFEAMASEKKKETQNDDDLFLDEMVADTDVTPPGMNAFGLKDDDFKFDDAMDDLPEIPADREAEQRLEARQKAAQVKQPANGPTEEKSKAATSKLTVPVWLQNIRESRPIMTGTLLGLLLLMGTSLYYGLWHKTGLAPAPHQMPPLPEKEVIMAAKQPAVAEPKPPPQPPPNRAPHAQDGAYKIAENSLGVLVQMSGQDEDGDALTFQITGKPRFGALYGDPPRSTYVANLGFPGQDMFEFSANDGKASSAPAVIRISGPDLTQFAARPRPETISAPALPRPKPQKEIVVAARAPDEGASRPVLSRAAKSRPEVVAASCSPQDILTENAPQPPPQPKASKSRHGVATDMHENIYTTSTEPVLIDWAELWRAATGTPFTAKEVVNIENADLHGRLERLSSARSRYTPDPFFVGEERIQYRFTVGKKRSKIRRINLIIANGNPPPQIWMKPLAKEIYAVGESVEFDASATRDDNRETLRFIWEQVAGPRVRLLAVNSEGSVVRFIAPSSFSNDQKQGLTLRLIAKDHSGQTASREVRVNTQSLRQSPLWGEVLAANNANQQTACPSGDCSALRLFR